MKKSILNLGKALHRAEQKSINGGSREDCHTYGCPTGLTCCDSGKCLRGANPCLAPDKGEI